MKFDDPELIDIRADDLPHLVDEGCDDRNRIAAIIQRCIARNPADNRKLEVIGGLA